MDSEKEWQIKLLRDAGCKCPNPLLGWRPGIGPRCRLCNTVAQAKAPIPTIGLANLPDEMVWLSPEEERAMWDNIPDVESKGN